MALLSEFIGAPRRRNGSFRRYLGLAVTVGVCCTGFAAAISDKLPENRVKAAFLYNFAHFVEWPAEAGAAAGSLIIAVLRDDDFVDEVARTVADKTVAGRRVEVRAIADVADVGASHMVFVGEDAAAEVDAILAALADRHVLTVSDVEGFVVRGGVIGLYKSENKLRFRINMAAARHAGLAISSKLLRLAEIVDGPVAGGRR